MGPIVRPGNLRLEPFDFNTLGDKVQEWADRRSRSVRVPNVSANTGQRPTGTSPRHLEWISGMPT